MMMMMMTIAAEDEQWGWWWALTVSIVLTHPFNRDNITTKLNSANKFVTIAEVRQQNEPGRRAKGLGFSAPMVNLPWARIYFLAFWWLLAKVEGGFDGTDLSGSLNVKIEHAPCVRLFSSSGDIGCRAPTRDGE